MAINSLGPLEADIMQVLWSKQKASVQDVHIELNQNRNIAYNTVMTVMTRLAKKEILGRTKQGRLYLYHPLVSREEIGKKMLQYLITKVYSQDHDLLLQELNSLLAQEKQA